jgi:hypothetical protein
MDALVGNDWIVWLALAATVYVFGTPLLILMTFRYEACPTVEVLDLDPHDPLPALVQEHLDLVQDQLTPLGFQAEGIFFLPRAARNVRTLFALYVNRSTQERAMAVTIYGRTKNGWRHLQFVEFNTRYTNGRDINTNNTNEIGAFKTSSTTLSTRIRWIADPVKLCNIHRAISLARGEAAPKELRLDTWSHGDASAHVANMLRESLEGARQSGYLRLSADGTHYRATFKGAYLMTWRILQPFKWCLLYNRDRQAKRLMAELGIAE